MPCRKWAALAAVIGVGLAGCATTAPPPDQAAAEVQTLPRLALAEPDPGPGTTPDRADALRLPMGRAALAGGQRRGDAQQSDDPRGAQRAHGQGQQGRGVHAAGVGHAQAAVVGDLCGEQIRDGLGVGQGLSAQQLLSGHRA